MLNKGDVVLIKSVDIELDRITYSIKLLDTNIVGLMGKVESTSSSWIRVKLPRKILTKYNGDPLSTYNSDCWLFREEQLELIFTT